MGIIFCGPIIHKIIDITPISSRLIKTEINTVPRCTILGAYAPQRGHTDEAKDSFWDLLQATTDKARTNRPLIIAGDLNARLHHRRVDETPIMGTFIYGKDPVALADPSDGAKDNRRRMTEYLDSNFLIAQNTRFQKPSTNS